MLRRENNTMRKVLTSVVAIMTIMAMLCGCSSDATKSMLSMASEVASRDNEVTGKLTISVDDSLYDVMQSLNGTDTVSDGAESADKGEEKLINNIKSALTDGITVDYYSKTMATDDNYIAEFSDEITFNGITEKISGVMDSNSGIYLSPSSISSIAHIVKSLDTENYLEFDADSITKAMSKMENGGVRYVSISDAEMPFDTTASIDDESIAQLTDMFSDIDLGDIISIRGNGVHIEFTGMQFIDIAGKVANKLISNEEHELNIKEDLLKSAEDGDGSVSALIELLESSVCKSDITSENGKIKSETELTVGMYGKNILKVTDISTSIERTNDMTYNASDSSQFKSYNEAVNMIMYEDAVSKGVKSVDISWYPDEYVQESDNVFSGTSKCTIYYSDDSCKTDYYNYIIEDDRIYLPLRDITERCGYEVTWDGSKAGVIVDGNNVEMSGIIHNDRTYIKIRDFENIGVVVNYIGETQERGNVAQLVFIN